MDDRFKTLMDRCIDDAVELTRDRDIADPNKTFEIALRLYGSRQQKYMMQVQFSQQLEMATYQPTDTPTRGTR